MARPAGWRPGVWCALAFLRAYKLFISPFFTGSCRFLPSCSDYARDAVVEHGAVRGTWLALKRLGRCHPFGSSGYDPVPRGGGPVPRGVGLTASADR